MIESTESRAPGSTAIDGKVLLIGIDSATWHVMMPMIEANRLPTFTRLTQEGACGPLKTLHPTLSPLIWSTISTGKSPEKHGMKSFAALRIPGLRKAVYDYRWEQLSSFSRLVYRVLRLNWWKTILIDRDVIRRIPLTSNFRRCKAVWNIVSDCGARTGFVGWWNSWPAEEVNGFWVSQYVELLLSAPPENLERAIYPEDALPEVMPYLRTNGTMRPEEVRRFFNLDDEDAKALASFRHSKFPSTKNYTPVQFLKLEYLCHEFRRKATRHLYDKYHPNLTGVFLSVDPAQHFFWHGMEPEQFEGVSPEDIRKYGTTIENWYVYLDEIVGELMAELGEDGTVVVVSDHGHEPSGELPWSGQHDDAPDGIVILCGEGVKEGFKITDASVYDITPTLLTLMGLPVGRDMDGVPLSDAITPEFLARHPIHYVETHESQEGQGERVAIESEGDAAIVQRLRDLGYIE